MRTAALAFALGAAVGFAAARLVPESAPEQPAEPGPGPAAASARPGPGRARAADPARAGRHDEPADDGGSGAEPLDAPGPVATRTIPEPPDSLLAAIEAEALRPSPPGDGMRVFGLARDLSGRRNPPRVGIDLLRALFAGRGHSSQAGRELLRLADPSAAAAELRGLFDGSRPAWSGAIAGEVEEALLRVAGDRLTDDEIRALSGRGEERARVAATDEALSRLLLSSADGLRIVQSNDLPAVRALVLERMARGDGGVAADRDAARAEVLRLSRDTADPIHETAIELLREIGPEGVARAAEVLADGGTPPHLVGSLTETLTRAGRFDVLERAPLDGEALELMLDAVGVFLADDTPPPDRAAIARMLRARPLPDGRDAAMMHLDLAVLAGAADVAEGVARRRDAAGWQRAAGVGVLADSWEHHGAAALAAAQVVLESDPVDATWRRKLLDDVGSMLAERSDEGRALVARLAERDPDPWVRRRARQVLADARPR